MPLCRCVSPKRTTCFPSSQVVELTWLFTSQLVTLVVSVTGPAEILKGMDWMDRKVLPSRRKILLTLCGRLASSP